MQRRIALKRLTASDLTLFSWHFRNRNAGNQKAINLNADVFIDKLFPSLPDAELEVSGRVPLDLSIYGPGLAGLHNLQRKILKGVAYKNWRLDGEFINNPESEPERYNILRPGDLAIFEFTGRITPKAAKLVLISRDHPADHSIYERLVSLLGTRSMMAVTPTQLEAVARELPDDGHPFYQLSLDHELEDAALGGARGQQALRRRAATRSVSPEELERARQAAQEIGRTGEEFVFAYFQALATAGVITRFRWEAETNAIAPYDFLVTLLEEQHIAVEVKSTTGEFNRPIHISLSELEEMAGNRRCDLYRVYDIFEGSAKLRIAENTRMFASTVIEGLRQIPQGVRIDSVSVDPNTLAFGPPIDLYAPGPDAEPLEQ